jgi:ABC-2 type transport system ATP-binding protein
LAVIEAINISKQFSDLYVLRDITLKVNKGEFFGLFGPNGAGKTTLLKILTGQIIQDSGIAMTAGIDANDSLGIKKVIGIVPEAETPPSFLTAGEVLEFICLIRSLDDVKGRLDFWLDFFDMYDKRDVLCRDLSKGQKQKLMLASAFIHEPKVLLLDEPFINLDPIYQRKVREYLVSLISEGRTIFMCTHILEIAEKLCTRIAVINNGRIIDEGTIEQMRLVEDEELEDIFIRLVEEGTEHRVENR